MYSSIVNGLSAFAMDFTIDGFLNNLASQGALWVSAIVTLVGLVMMGFGIFKVGKGFVSDRAQTNWVMAIGAIVLGGALAAGGGFGLLQTMSSGVLNEVNQMGGGAAALFFSQYLPW